MYFFLVSSLENQKPFLEHTQERKEARLVSLVMALVTLCCEWAANCSNTPSFPSLFFVSPPLPCSSKPFPMITCFYHSALPPKSQALLSKPPTCGSSLQRGPSALCLLHMYILSALWHQAGLICIPTRIMWEWWCVTCTVKVTKDAWLPPRCVSDH